ncbi:MAG: TldD/PmbA family protein [Chloroflexota bacterium]
MTQATTQIDAILDAAKRSGAQQAEVFHVLNEETPVKFESNRLKELNARQTSGVALRVIANGRIGFASSSRPGDVDDVVAAALDTAPFGPEAEFDFPGPSEAPDVPVYDAATVAVSTDDLIHLGQSLIDAVVAAESDIKCDGSVRKAVGTVTLANSNGGRFTFTGTVFSAGIYGTLIRGTDMLFVGEGDANVSPKLDTQMIKDTILQQLEYGRKSATCRTADMPVIFTSPGVASAIVGPLSMAFNGRLVHQGQSPLVGQLGQEKYGARISLHDDATLSMRPGSRPFDDEGVPSRLIPLIERGVVTSFMYDLQTAGLAETQSTGSAARSLTSQPMISTSSLVFSTGDKTFAEMVKSVKEGIVVEELMGAGQGNVLGGDFSGNVLLGYKIENGEIIGRVKDTIVAGNVHEAVRNVLAIGSEARWVNGSVYAPPLLFERLAVSSKE